MQLVCKVYRRQFWFNCSERNIYQNIAFFHYIISAMVWNKNALLSTFIIMIQVSYRILFFSKIKVLSKKCLISNFKTFKCPFLTKSKHAKWVYRKVLNCQHLWNSFSLYIRVWILKKPWSYKKRIKILKTATSYNEKKKCLHRPFRKKNTAAK